MGGSGPVLVALELAGSDRAVAEVAAAYARCLNAKLYMVHVLPLPDEEFSGLAKAIDTAPVEPDTAEGEKDDVEDEAGLARLKAALERQGLEVTALQVSGLPGDKIVREAQRLGASLIVSGHRRRTVLGEIVFGSTSRDILQAAPCPVLLIPQA